MSIGHPCEPRGYGVHKPSLLHRRPRTRRGPHARSFAFFSRKRLFPVAAVSGSVLLPRAARLYWVSQVHDLVQGRRNSVCRTRSNAVWPLQGLAKPGGLCARRAARVASQQRPPPCGAVDSFRLPRKVCVGSCGKGPLPALVSARVGTDLMQLRHGSVTEGLCGRQLQQTGGIGALGTSVRPRLFVTLRCAARRRRQAGRCTRPSCQPRGATACWRSRAQVASTPDVAQAVQRSPSASIKLPASCTCAAPAAAKAGGGAAGGRESRRWVRKRHLVWATAEALETQV